MAAEDATASLDHRHRFVGNATYALPNFGGSGSGLMSELGSGWQANAIVVLESGAPFTVNIGTDRANIGAGPAQRPDQTCDPRGWGETVPTVVQYGLFHPSAAVHLWQRTPQLGAGAWLCGPGRSHSKGCRLGHGSRLQFRWEIFNLLNRMNFDVPNRIAFTPNFGRIFSSKPPRQMQFGVKLLF